MLYRHFTHDLSSLSWHSMKLPERKLDKGTCCSQHTKYPARANQWKFRKYDSWRGISYLERWQGEKQGRERIAILCRAVWRYLTNRVDSWPSVYTKARLYCNATAKRTVNECYVNGARYTVDYMKNSVLFLLSVYGRGSTKHFILPRVPCERREEYSPPPGFCRTQFPFRVCSAISTKKARVQSLGRGLGIDLRHRCFKHGRLNVALSRVTNPSKTAVYTTDASMSTTNLVYRSVLCTPWMFL